MEKIIFLLIIMKYITTVHLEKFHNETENFLRENHQDFLSKYSQYQWTVVYKKFIYPPISLFNFT